MSVLVPDDVDGRGILTLTWRSTFAFALSAILAAIWATTFLRVVALTIALGLFAVGIVAFLGAYFRAIGRSRREQISVAGVYLLMGGAAPASVRRSLLGALAVQIVVALSTAAARPYSSLAFGVLVPLLGVALCGWWSAAYGVFPARPDQSHFVDDGDGEHDDALAAEHTTDDDGSPAGVDRTRAEDAGE
jgi:hypothetical protein